MATKKAKQPRLTLAGLLGALSFWGTSARLLLMAFLATAVLVIHLADAPRNYESEIQAFIYILGSFFVLDAGYVMLARGLPFKRAVDVTILLIVDLLVALLYLVPTFVNSPGLSWLAQWTILIALLVISARAVLGLVLPVSQRK